MKILLNKYVKFNYEGNLVLGQVLSQLGDSVDIKVMDSDELSYIKVINIKIKELEEVHVKELMTEDFINKLYHENFYENILDIIDKQNIEESFLEETIKKAIEDNFYLTNLDEVDSEHIFGEIIHLIKSSI
jgi:hypothetical protein